jgi:hypothetical protein
MGRHPRCTGGGVNEKYQEFLRAKARLAPALGFDIRDDEINPILKPHQRDIVRWAVKGGRRAIFAAFGLGKSMMQIEAIRLVLSHGGGRGLIIAPLGVRQEFRRDGAKLGVDIKFVRHVDECEATGIYITNYETVRDGKLDPNEFAAISLDEASVLRSYGSKTYQTFLSIFTACRFRFVATATPSPNRYKELIHYAGFLGIMDTGQALTRFFQRDSTKANNLTLYPHKEREFWIWLNSWAIFLQKPSDLGHSDEGYTLPPMDIRYHVVRTNILTDEVDRDGQGSLFRDAAIGLRDASREKRSTMAARTECLRNIIAADPDSHFIIWHDLEDERRAIDEAIPENKSVYGTLDLEEREQRIIDFSEGKFKYLSAKPVLAGSGCNFQHHCHKAVFMGIGFKFNDFIQAVHRIQRFLQRHPVEIHIIYAETETEVMRTLQEKWANHNQMVEHMAEVIREHGLNELSLSNALTRSIGCDRVEVSGRDWLAANNDCIVETEGMAENSIDLIVTSVPFSNHYEYTPSYNDMGHTDSDDHFFAQMDFLSPQLLRILKPGRLACIHTKDRILFGNVTGKGMPTVNPFHAKCLFHYLKHGFAYMGMITVNTDVVRENNQTYRLGWTENSKDGTKMGVGSPEYILLFRKLPSDTSRAYADEPVKKNKTDYTRARWQTDAHAFWRSSGDRLLTPDELAALKPDVLSRLFTDQSLKQVYNFKDHVATGEALEAKGALPATFMSLAPGSHDPMIWHDVNRMLTLNGEQSRKALEMHVCPLQFDIVDRLIERYSNPGDLVFDPFGGLMTVPYRALKLGRKGRGVELNPISFRDGVKHLQAMEASLAVPSLFDVLDAEAA